MQHPNPTSDKVRFAALLGGAYQHRDTGESVLFGAGHFVAAICFTVSTGQFNTRYFGIILTNAYF